MIFPELQREGSDRQLLCRDERGCRNRGGGSRKIQHSHPKRVLGPPQGMKQSMWSCESFLRSEALPAQAKAKHGEPQTAGIRRLMVEIPGIPPLPQHLPIGRKSHTPNILPIKLLPENQREVQNFRSTLRDGCARVSFKQCV